MSQCPKCDAASLKMSHTHECVSPLRLRSHPACSTHPSASSARCTPFLLGDGTFCCCEPPQTPKSTHPLVHLFLYRSLFFYFCLMCHRTLYTNFGHIFIAPQPRQGAEGEDFSSRASRNNNFPPSPAVGNAPPPQTDLPMCTSRSDSDSAPTSNSLDAFYGGETNKAMTTPFFPSRLKNPEKRRKHLARRLLLLC